MKAFSVIVNKMTACRHFLSTEHEKPEWMMSKTKFYELLSWFDKFYEVLQSEKG